MGITKKTSGPESREMADVLYLLGLTYIAQNRFNEAEVLHKRALAIKEEGAGATTR